MSALKKVFTFVSIIALVSFSPTVALAHTETEATSPSAGESVDAGEHLISISFTDNILELPDSSEIVVLDPAGKVAPADCSGVEKKKIFTNAFLASEGNYSVTWRTVAEDGHPITGKFEFTVIGNAEEEYTKPACAADSPEPTPKVIASPPAPVVSKQESGLEVPISIGAFALGTALAIMWLVRRTSVSSKD